MIIQDNIIESILLLVRNINPDRRCYRMKEDLRGNIRAWMFRNRFSELFSLSMSLLRESGLLDFFYGIENRLIFLADVENRRNIQFLDEAGQNALSDWEKLKSIALITLVLQGGCFILLLCEIGWNKVKTRKLKGVWN
jgi:hypothetical protein